MPSASNELHNEMQRLFGNPIDDNEPIEFLRAAGYVLLRGFTWQGKPGVTDYSQMTQDEYTCLLFLVQEWDFGGLASAEKETRGS